MEERPIKIFCHSSGMTCTSVVAQKWKEYTDGRYILKEESRELKIN